MDKNLTVLWLDDKRNPYNYLNKKSDSKTFKRNKSYYDNLMNKRNIKFVWVKNFEEFTGFILKNGIPQFISFDHDLGKGLKKGFECAKWLLNYCKANNKELPRFYVHSANPNGQREINGLLNGGNTTNLTEAEIKRKFVNLVSTAQIIKMLKMHGYEGNYTERAIYITLNKYGVKPRTKRGGKPYFDKKSACDCIGRHIFEVRKLSEMSITRNPQREEPEWNVGYGRGDMSVASREALANDGVFGADENKLYATNEGFNFANIVNETLKDKNRKCNSQNRF